jgi:hypothetical protein
LPENKGHNKLTLVIVLSKFQAVSEKLCKPKGWLDLYVCPERTEREEPMARGRKYHPEELGKSAAPDRSGCLEPGKTTAQACEEAGIVEQTYSLGRKEYGGLQMCCEGPKVPLKRKPLGRLWLNDGSGVRL